MTNFDDWDTLKDAENKGWIDPGFTEPLSVTVERAKEYLREWALTQAATPPVTPDA